MTRKELAFWFIAGIILCIVFLPLPARAQVSEETLRLQALERIIASQNATINKALDVLKEQAAKQPVVIGGMPQAAPAPVIVEAEKPCEDSLIGCALRGFGSLLARAGNKGIDFLDRNFVPVAQIASNAYSARKQTELGIKSAEYAYMERRDVSQANAASIQMLGQGMQNIAFKGYDTISLLPPRDVTNNNISGTGINFGSGTLTYAPISGSYNPVNPTARVCQATTTGLFCQ